MRGGTAKGEEDKGKDETWLWYGEEESGQGEVQYLRGWEEGEV